MNRTDASPNAPEWRGTRRSLLRAVGATATVGVAGCTGGDDAEPTATEEEPELPPEEQAAIDIWMETVEGELSMREWRLVAGEFVPRYYSENTHVEDTPILAEAYTGMVEVGFEYDAMPTAFDEDDTIHYMLHIRQEWALAYLDDELSEAEYFERIEETLH